MANVPQFIRITRCLRLRAFWVRADTHGGSPSVNRCSRCGIVEWIRSGFDVGARATACHLSIQCGSVGALNCGVVCIRIWVIERSVAKISRNVPVRFPTTSHKLFSLHQ